MNFSLEIGPKTDLETLPPVKDVYVTMLPGGDYKETSDQSIELVKISEKISEIHKTYKNYLKVKKIQFNRIRILEKR